MVRFGFPVAVLVAAGCAGRSIATEEAGGTSGAGGTSSGATGGQGGTAGTVATGGGGGTVAAGGSGGSGATGGVAQGGASGTVAFGGTGAIIPPAGAGGSSGAGAACGLPLESGPCDALFHAFGFDSARGHCVRFAYGGCEGNDNRFDTLGECEAACGGSSVGACPERLPVPMATCATPGLQCVYDTPDGCLCASTRSPFCSKIDPQCPGVLRDAPPPDDGECVGDECVSRIVLPLRDICWCGDGGWECVTQR